MSSAGDRTTRAVSGALRNAIHAHGPITEQNIGSATKRVVAELRAAAENGTKVLLADGALAEHTTIEALYKRLEKLQHGHKRLIQQYDRLRAAQPAAVPPADVSSLDA